MRSQSRVVLTGIVVVVAALSGPAGSVAEGNETNTSSAAVVRIGSDLSVSSLSAPTRAAVGSAIVVTDTTTNPGAGGANASVTAFYLSANSTLDATDVRLAPARAIGPLAAGAASAGAANVIIPEIAPGAWFLIANADDDGLVDEMAESNNARIVS
ncbi:MAG: CARDB domain-containing protein, partial [Solimonas sp.]